MDKDMSAGSVYARWTDLSQAPSEAVEQNGISALLKRAFSPSGDA